MSNPLKKSWQRVAASVPFVSGQADPLHRSVASLSVTELKLLSSLPGAICACRPDTEVVWLNQLCSDLFDMRASSGQSQYLGDLIDQNMFQKIRPLVESVAAGGEEMNCNLTFLNNSKLPGSQHYRLQLSRYSASDIQCSKPIVLLVFNPTQGETEVLEARQSLEQDGHSQIEMMTKLLSATSHEMRTPLNAIIGFSQMLEGKAGQTLSREKQIEYAALVEKSARQMLEMTNDLLDLSKLRSDSFELQEEELDAVRLTDEAVLSLKPVFQARGMAVHINAAENLPHIKADERSFRQIMINLLSNAIKFSEPGQGVGIDIKRTIKSLEISVIDSGRGITAPALEKLGTEYFRELQDAGPEGNGLGLSIAYRLIEKMSGSIRVVSEPGKGSTFTVSLPLKAASARPVPTNPEGDVVYLKPDRVEYNDNSAPVPLANTI